jgi:MFS transporter, Spinster family, sphingosine-1-phosphate transporter
MLCILTGLNLVNYMDRFVLNAVRTPMADDLRIDYGDSGRTFTAFMLGYFITSPFFGYLGDRLSRKWLIAVGILVWCLGTVLTGFATGFGMLLVFRALVGVGEASYATISPGLICDSWPSDKRNNALTIFYVAMPVGAAVGYVLGGVLAAHWGWRSAFYWAGAPGLLLALALLTFREPQRGESDHAAEKLRKPRPADIAKLLLNAELNLVIWGYVAYTFAMGGFAFWGPTFLEKVHGLSNVKANSFFGAVLVVGGLAGTLLGGFAATAWHKRNPAGYAWLLAGSVFLSVPLAFLALGTSSALVAMISLAAAIFLLFLSTGPVNTLILESVPVNMRSLAMALSIFMIHLFGDLWSPEIVGRAADRLGGNLQKAVLLLPLALLLAAFLWLALALKTRRSLRGATATIDAS